MHLIPHEFSTGVGRVRMFAVCAIATALGPSILRAQLVRLELVHQHDGGMPLFVAQAPGNPASRLFMVIKEGEIRILQNGQLLPEPFLDVRSTTNASGFETGLLGLAFHPSYATNGRFYIFQVMGPERWATVIEYTAAGDPISSTFADPQSRREVLRMHSVSSHVGGWMDFGPDGTLYISTGDGGFGASEHSQSLESRRGKVLRIDVDGRDPGLEYAIPPSNPFAGAIPGRDEIWAYGLRNPWRCSFDRATDDLWIADVGEGMAEEVNLQAAGAPGGANYGWHCYEGPHVTGKAGCEPPPTPVEFPLYSYGRPVTNGGAIIGGYVYRGTLMPRLSGWYVFGENSLNSIFGIDTADPPPPGTGPMQIAASSLFVTSLGEDADGELYVTGWREVYRVVAEPCGPADLSAGSTPGARGYGQPNGVLEEDDFLYFMAEFAAGRTTVDLTTGAIPGQLGYGLPDGTVNNDDFFYYLSLYSAGC